MRRPENNLTLPKEQKEKAAILIKEYFEEELDTEIGLLRAGFFVDFLSEQIGKYFYNKGIADCSTYMEEKVEDLFLLMKDED